jgi:glutathione S-transferase
MKLHWSPRSPFVRKVMVVAHETALAGRIECVRTPVAIVKPHMELMLDNPLSKIPTLILEDGTPLYDSSVITEYLDTLHSGPKLFPAEGKARWTALRRQALGDGLLDHLILWRNERERPKEQRSALHLAAYEAKLDATLKRFEDELPDLEATPFGIGHIAIGVAVAYLDFRFANLNWRNRRPILAEWHAPFAARPSMRATEPVDD